MATNVEVGLALLLGVTLFFSVWVWYRAPQRSGDRQVLPISILCVGAMLIMILPRVVWPNSVGMRIGGVVVSTVLTAAAAVTMFRRTRERRQGPRS
jgi:O-antigen/teichoic acid export membrane protein